MIFLLNFKLEQWNVILFVEEKMIENKFSKAI